MMKALVAGLAVLLVLGGAMTAAAADARLLTTPEFCDALARVLEAAPRGFADLEGPPINRRLEMWHATVALPGTKDCVLYGPPLHWYSCRVYVGVRDRDAALAQRNLVDEVGACLGKRWSKRARVSGLRDETVFRWGPRSATIRVLGRQSRAAAYAVDVMIEAPPQKRPRPARARHRR